VIESATPRLQVGQQHGAARVEDLGGLGHKPDPGEDDGRAVGLHRLARKVERVADKVGDVLDLRTLVVVGKQYRVPFLLEPKDLLGQHHRRPRFLDRAAS
jgi:hypothetical protein